MSVKKKGEIHTLPPYEAISKVQETAEKKLEKEVC